MAKRATRDVNRGVMSVCKRLLFHMQASGSGSGGFPGWLGTGGCPGGDGAGIGCGSERGVASKVGNFMSHLQKREKSPLPPSQGDPAAASIAGAMLDRDFSSRPA